MGPDEVRAWVEGQTGQSVVRFDALVGGMSSDVSRCQLANGSTLIVRHFADAIWLARHPHIIDEEGAALQVLVDSDLPTPRLLASDAALGLLAMSEMPGSVRADARFLADQVDTIADTAASIADVALPADHRLPPWRQWIPANPEPPAWGDSALWTRAIAAGRARQPPDGPTVMLHRDLHPLNLLWTGDQITDVVDWVNGCVGHPHAELGHCRWNLAVLAGPAAADRFLEHYLARTNSAPYDPWWDLVVPLSFLPGPIGRSAWQDLGRDDLTAQAVVRATEVFLAAALEATG